MNTNQQRLAVSALILALCAFVCHYGWPASNKVELVEIRSMQKCTPCDTVFAKLERDGVEYHVKPVDSVTATSFPCCIYRNDSWDNGERILKGDYFVPHGNIVKVTKLVVK